MTIHQCGCFQNLLMWFLSELRSQYLFLKWNCTNTPNMLSGPKMSLIVTMLWEGHPWSWEPPIFPTVTPHKGHRAKEFRAWNVFWMNWISPLSLWCPMHFELVLSSLYSKRQPRQTYARPTEIVDFLCCCHSLHNIFHFSLILLDFDWIRLGMFLRKFAGRLAIRL